jgi:hypothetical protein
MFADDQGLAETAIGFTDQFVEEFRPEPAPKPKGRRR